MLLRQAAALRARERGDQGVRVVEIRLTIIPALDNVQCLSRNNDPW
jgi:hypothetical protein